MSDRPIPPAEHLVEREASRAEALRIARALHEGGPLDVSPLLNSWRFSASPDLIQRVLNHLRAHPPDVAPPLLFAALAPPELLPPWPRGHGTALPAIHRAVLEQACLDRGPMFPPLPFDDPPEVLALAWALDNLNFLGVQIEQRQREAWARRDYAPSPDDKDHRVQRMWRRWFTGDRDAFYKSQVVWERVLVKPATNAFRAELLARGLPPHVADHQARQMAEGFDFQLFYGAKKHHGEPDPTPGWLELALRVLETAGDGPVLALASRVPEGSLGELAQCATSRGYWAQTGAQLWPELHRQGGRALSVRQRVRGDRLATEELLDAHVALRLIQVWSSRGVTEADQSWGVIRSNRGRGRVRLRALLATLPPKVIQELLLGLPALHARTVSAMKWYARDWARAEIKRSFSFNSRPFTPPCAPVPATLKPLDEEDLAPLDTWLMLVAMKERWSALEEWTHTGKTSTNDPGFYRLLSSELPRSLTDSGADADKNARCDTYDRLRLHLQDAWEEHEDLLLKRLRSIAQLDHKKASLRQVFIDTVGNWWNDQISLPQRGYEGYILTARALEARLSKEKEER